MEEFNQLAFDNNDFECRKNKKINRSFPHSHPKTIPTKGAKPESK